LSFWKCGSRKIYAVKTNPRSTKRLNKSKEKIISHYDVSDDSDDEFVSTSKKAKLVTSMDFQQLKSQLDEMKGMINDILQVNQEVSLPVGVVKLVRDAFMCKICHVTPITPPVIATKCCSTLLGCEVCVNRWYNGTDSLSKKCPYCNEPRGYASTYQFKGLDEFLAGVGNMIKGADVDMPENHVE
jgi:rubrerythrin